MPPLHGLGHRRDGGAGGVHRRLAGSRHDVGVGVDHALAGREDAVDVAGDVHAVDVGIARRGCEPLLDLVTQTGQERVDPLGPFGVPGDAVRGLRGMGEDDCHKV